MSLISPPPTPERRCPRPHQQEALQALSSALRHGGRAQLLAACGTGKTLIGRWLATELGAHRTVVLVPSLALVAQTLAEWRRSGQQPFEALIVCSDPSTAIGAGERGEDSWQVDAQFWSRHGARVTTRPVVVADFLRCSRPDRPQVLMCTYHSARVLADALHDTGDVVDLMVCDEAHHLAGAPREDFRVVLDDRQVPAARRLFMTATPVTADRGDGRLSMDDERTFGRVAYRIDFAAAIAAGLLCDYDVLVLDAACPQPAAGSAAPAALVAAANSGVQRMLAFHGRVAKARGFAAAVDGLALPDGRRVSAEAVAGADSAAVRAQALRRLADGGPHRLTVLSNARCLAEGVDVPAVDGVLFADPRTSATDIIQAVGRALRPAPGKRRSLILVPVVLDRDGLDDDTVLSAGPFAAVWTVLRALRSMDERFTAGLRASVGPSRRGMATGRRQHPRILFDLPGDVDLSRLVARLVDTSSCSWDTMFEQLRAAVADTGDALIPRGTALGEWVQRQRQARNRGALPQHRAAQLAALPGWAWDHQQACWLRNLAIVAAHVRGRGLQLDDVAGMSRPVPHPASKSTVNTVGRWCAAQRIAYRRGDLEPGQIGACEDIAGWSWQAVPARDAGMVDLLAEWVAWKGDANVPGDVVEDGQPLGAFVAALRRRRVTGRLTCALDDELACVLPSRSSPGALRWDAAGTRWRLSYLALRQFAGREGHCQVPAGHVEVLRDFEVDLQSWCRRIRHEHRTGQLDAERVAAVGAVPGWRWEIQPSPRIALDVGDSRHGSRTGYVKGCKCAACAEANRADHADRDARAAAGLPTTDLVDARAARGQLRILAGQGATQKGMARAADVNVKTVLGVMDGSTARILPATDAALRALTLSAVRLAAAPGARVDAGPTWAALQAMIDRGWPKSWLARELGLGAALQLRRGAICARNADAVAALAQALGLRRPPPREGRRPLPNLASILELEAAAREAQGIAS